MTTTPKTINGIPLPSWGDAASVTSYITSLVAVAVTIVTAVHPGFTEPVVVQSVLPAVGFVVAGVAQLVNIWTHRGAQKAAITAGFATDQATPA
jgi:hypothetical protein